MKGFDMKRFARTFRWTFQTELTGILAGTCGITFGFLVCVIAQLWPVLKSGGDITIALGVDLNGTVTGFSPLQHSETPGFGAKCADESYIATFPGITSSEEVDVITGATFTTTAIKEAVGAGLYFVDQMLLAGS